MLKFILGSVETLSPVQDNYFNEDREESGEKEKKRRHGFRGRRIRLRGYYRHNSSFSSLISSSYSHSKQTELEVPILS